MKVLKSKQKKKTCARPLPIFHFINKRFGVRPSSSLFSFFVSFLLFFFFEEMCVHKSAWSFHSMSVNHRHFRLLFNWLPFVNALNTSFIYYILPRSNARLTVSIPIAFFVLISFHLARLFSPSTFHYVHHHHWNNHNIYSTEMPGIKRKAYTGEMHN